MLVFSSTYASYFEGREEGVVSQEYLEAISGVHTGLKKYCTSELECSSQSDTHAHGKLVFFISFCEHLELLSAFLLLFTPKPHLIFLTDVGDSEISP